MMVSRHRERSAAIQTTQLPATKNISGVNMKTKLKILIILALLTCLLTACTGITVQEHNIIVAGSTSVQPYAEKLAELYMAGNAGSVIDIQGGGSSAGITAAETGTANIGMSSRLLKEKEQGLWSIEIAKDGLAIIIHPANQIDDLTLEQIRSIYQGDIKNWNELGGDNKNIHVITREEGSGTRSAFEDLVMDKNRIKPKAIVQPSNGSVRQQVSDDKYAIGFISLGLVDHQPGLKPVKAIKIDGIEATRENVINESYSLFRPFLFVTEEKPTGKTEQFIEFVLSQEGQTILSKEGLIPTGDN